MAADWQELTRMTQGERVVVERVRIPSRGIAIEGQFDLPPLAGLPAEDQVFVAAFVQSHGSIKRMEQIFGVSYPTIKNRLNRITAQLGLVEEVPPNRSEEAIAGLERGELTVEQALEMLG